MSGLLSVLLDVIVLAGLGVTIYYCIRLSKSLNNFRQYRQEFNILLQELSKNIDHAQNAIEKLKDTSFEAGEDLQKVINNSRNLADELQLMNDMGNALANRLERLSEKGRDKVSEDSKVDFGSARTPEAKDFKAKKTPPKPAPKSDAKKPAFFIQDREFERGDLDDEDLNDDFEDDNDEFQSQAERELFEALKKNKKGKVF